MSNVYSRSTLYRVLFVAFAAYLLFLAVGHTYRLVSSTTDENIFRSPPSYFYITTPLPADTASSKYGSAAFADSVHIGDLLLAIDGKRVRRKQSLHDIWQDLPQDSLVTITIFRSRKNRGERVTVARSALTRYFVDKLPDCVYVQDVTRGGASDLAGMKVGDFIYRINGQTFDSALGADIILRRAKSGSTIAYDVIRDNRSITLAVTLARFGIQFDRILLLLTGLVFFGTGLFVAIKRPQLVAARLLGFTFLALGFVLLVQGFNRDTEIDLFSHARNFTLFFCFFFGIATWIHSSFHFPAEYRTLLKKRWLLRIPYALAVVMTLLNWSIVVWGLQSETLVSIVARTLLGILVLYGIAIKFIFRKQRAAEAVKVGRIIRWSTVLAIGIMFGIGILQSLNQSLRYVGYVFFPLLLIPLAYLYTIGRYQLLDMDLRVKRNIRYIIVSALWQVGLFVLLAKTLLSLPDISFDLPNIRFTGTSIEFLDAPPDAAFHDFLGKLLLIVMAITSAFLFLKIGRIGQRVINRIFDQKAYDSSRATSELAEVMATKVSMSELATGIAEKLAEFLQLKRVGVLFFRDQTDCCCHQAYGFEGDGWSEFCVKNIPQLTAEIQKVHADTRFCVDYLPDDVRTAFTTHGFFQVIPLRFKEKLVGAFLIGEKLSESPLNLEDLTFLTAVAKQASIAIENTFLHEELTEQERLKHELKIARRIQMASLPQKTPEVEGLDISGVSLPALEVGGDYFDYLNGGDSNFTVIIGDVSGKGTSAALYMSKVQGILRSLFQFNLSPRELFIRANHLLARDLEKQSFITAIGAAIDARRRKMTLARAGHLPLFYYQAKTASVSLITPRGLGLGLDETTVFETELEEVVIDYEKDDVFLFITDGVTEAQTQNGSEFGEEKLQALLAEHVASSAKDICDEVISSVQAFAQDTVQHDDQTVVVIKAR